MNCNKVSNLLSAYMDGELMGYEHRLIHHHLQRCCRCQTEYEELLQMKRLLGAMRLQAPGRNLAASICRRIAVDSPRSRVQASMLRVGSISAPRSRALLTSPALGLGLGLACFGVFMWAHPARTADTPDGARQMEFETADVTRDIPAPRIGELTSGLMREEAPRPAAFEPRYPDDLPDFPLATHHSRQSQRSFETTSLFR